MVGPTLVWPGRVNSMTASRSLLRNTKCKGLALRPSPLHFVLQEALSVATCNLSAKPIS